MAQVPKSWTLLISKQLSYFENVPMGFDKKAIVSVPFPADSLGSVKLITCETACWP